MRRLPRIRLWRVAATWACLGVVFCGPASAETRQTNVINGISVNYAGTYLVGSNGPLNALIVTNNADLNSTAGIVGDLAGADHNSALITGSGSIWNNSNDLTIGNSGSFNGLTISDGGTVADSYGGVGDGKSASNNVVLVSGANSLWTNRFYLSVGDYGSDNRLTISDGGTVVNNGCYLGDTHYASNNVVLVAGADSLWHNGSWLRVGNQGSCNRLTISNGGAVANDSGFVGYGGLASSNAVLVTGADSLWNNRTNLSVGDSGSCNRLTISDGATVASGNAYVGQDSRASNNAVLVTGASSLWTNRNDLHVGCFGSGNRLTITNGGMVKSENGYVGCGSNASDNAVLVTGAGSLWTNTSLTVGDYGSGNRLTISDGGTVADSYGCVGDEKSASNNVVMVTGANSLWTNRSYLSVGDYGSGNRLTISGGGTVANNGCYLGDTHYASNNVVLVTGADSLWDNGSWLRVGNQGSCNGLIISNGGAVADDNGFVGYGGLARSNAVLVIGADSLWTNRNNLYVGHEGPDNQLSIADGGSVVASGVVVGRVSAATGSLVAVIGGNLQAVGPAGSGSLEVRHGLLSLNGGSVATDQLILTNAGGQMSFNAGTLSARGSALANTFAFTIGDGAQGATMNLLGGAHGFSDGLVINTNATVSGWGTVSAAIANYGVLSASNGVMRLEGGAVTGTGGVVLVRPGAQLDAAGDVGSVASVVTNELGGVFKNTGGQITFLDVFVNNGKYISDSGTNFFTTLQVGASGALNGGPGDEFVIQGNLLNASTNAFTFDLAGSALGFGIGSHTFEFAGADLGLDWSGYSNNFAIGELEIAPGGTVTIEDGNTGNDGTALYVLRFNADTQQVTSAFNIYYAPSLNPELNDEIHALAGGGWLIPVPEPAAWAWLLLGVGAILRKRRLK